MLTLPVSTVDRAVSIPEVLNPARRIHEQFATDRATWRLLSLQARLKQAKSPETKAAIVEAIQAHIRTMALLYTDVHTEGYRSGVEFGKQNASFYHNVEMVKRVLPHRKVEVKTFDRRPYVTVNGRSID